MAKSVTRWWALIVAVILGFVSRDGLAQDSQNAEQNAFEKARAENSEAAYRDFLRRYPESQFTAEAFRDLVSTVVKSERPLFEPAFDNQLLVEGLMPAPLKPTVTATTSDEPASAATTLDAAVSSTSPSASERLTNGETAPEFSATNRGPVTSRLRDPY